MSLVMIKCLLYLLEIGQWEPRLGEELLQQNLMTMQVCYLDAANVAAHCLQLINSPFTFYRLCCMNQLDLCLQCLPFVPSLHFCLGDSLWKFEIALDFFDDVFKSSLWLIHVVFLSWAPLYNNNAWLMDVIGFPDEQVMTHSIRCPFWMPALVLHQTHTEK